MKEPNYKALQAIAGRIESLKSQGKWDRAEFDKALADGREVAGGEGYLVEFIINEAPVPDPVQK